MITDKKNQPGLAGQWCRTQEETPYQIFEEHRQKTRENLQKRRAAAVAKEENDDETEVVINIKRN